MDFKDLQSLIAERFESLRELSAEERLALRAELEAQAIAVGAVLRVLDTLDPPMGRLQLPKLPPPTSPQPSPCQGEGAGPGATRLGRLRNQPAIKQDRRRRTK